MSEPICEKCGRGLLSHNKNQLCFSLKRHQTMSEKMEVEAERERIRKAVEGMKDPDCDTWWWQGRNAALRDVLEVIGGKDGK